MAELSNDNLPSTVLPASPELTVEESIPSREDASREDASREDASREDGKRKPDSSNLPDYFKKNRA
jgi:hypothetical protein